MLRTLTISKEK